MPYLFAMDQWTKPNWKFIVLVIHPYWAHWYRYSFLYVLYRNCIIEFITGFRRIFQKSMIHHFWLMAIMTVHLGHLELAIVALVLVRILTFWSITGWYWFLFHVCISLPASMLELARLIVDSKWVPPQPVIFLFNGAEELFLLVIPLSLSLSLHTDTHTHRKAPYART